MFYKFLIALIIIYVIYYLVMIGLEVKKLNKSEGVDDMGDDVDISSAVGNYIPIDSSDIISDDKDSEIKDENEKESQSNLQDYYEALADNTDYSEAVVPGGSHTMTDEDNDKRSSDDFLNEFNDTIEETSHHSEEGHDEEAEPVQGGGGRRQPLDLNVAGEEASHDDSENFDEEDDEDLEDAQVAAHGGYYACNLEQMFREEFERVGEEFVGMRVTPKK